TPGVAYSFGADITTPTRLWQLPSSACGGSRAMLSDDIDGDGRPDVVLSTHDDIRILDGTTGQLKGATADLGDWISMAHCEPAEIEPGGGKELICAFGTSLAPTGNGHRVFALGWKTSPARLDVLWSTNV